MSRHPFARRKRRRTGRRLPLDASSNGEVRPARPDSARDLFEKAKRAAEDRLIAEMYAEPDSMMAQLTRLDLLPRLLAEGRLPPDMAAQLAKG